MWLDQSTAHSSFIWSITCSGNNQRFVRLRRSMSREGVSGYRKFSRLFRHLSGSSFQNDFRCAIYFWYCTILFLEFHAWGERSWKNNICLSKCSMSSWIFGVSTVSHAHGHHSLLWNIESQCHGIICHSTDSKWTPACANWCTISSSESATISAINWATSTVVVFAQSFPPISNRGIHVDPVFTAAKTILEIYKDNYLYIKYLIMQIIIARSFEKEEHTYHLLGELWDLHLFVFRENKWFVHFL